MGNAPAAPRGRRFVRRGGRSAAILLVAASVLTPAAAQALNETARPPGPALSRRPVTVADVLALGDLRGLFVSPDGRYAVTLLSRPELADNSYDIHWVIVPLAGGPARNGGDAGDREFFDSRRRLDGRRGHFFALRAAWSPDGRSFAYLRQAAGEVQVWRTSLDGLRQEQLTRNAADVEDFVWSDDGERLFYATAAPRAALQEMAARRDREGFLLTSRTPWSFEHQRPLLDRYAPVGGHPVVWALDVGSRTERRAAPAEIAEFRRLVERRDEVVAASPSPRAPTLSMPLVDPEQSVDEPPRALRLGAGGETFGCAPFACAGVFEPVQEARRATRAWWFNAGLYLLRREGPNAPGVTLWRWPVGRAIARPVLRSQDDLTDCARVGRALVCLRQTPDAPRKIIRIDLERGRIGEVFDPNPQWAQVARGESSWIGWSDRQGRPTYGVLIKPIGFRPGGRYPFVVIGYSAADAVRGDAGRRFPAQVLAARGFVTLVYHMWEPPSDLHRPDFLARMYGGEAPDGEVSYAQIEALVERLVAQGMIDPRRVGVGGHSEALNTIAYGLTHGDLFRAVSLGWIRWNPSDYFRPTDGYREKLERAGLLRDPAWPPSPIIRDFSLAYNVERVRAPVLVNASGLELEPLMQWEALRRFEAADRPLEMHVAPGEPHVVFQPIHRLIEYRRNVQWFEYWLQDREEPDPVDPDQYARWSLMRAQLARLGRGSEGPPGPGDPRTASDLAKAAH